MSNLNINTSNSVALNTQKEITMTSQEIADLVDKRHDNVKRTIETLVEAGVIQLPQSEGVKNHLGQMVVNYIFSGDQGKRDTTVIVAQLSPQFTGQLVDRWIELEKQVATPSYMIDDPVERAKKWIEETTAKQEAETKLVEAQQVIAIQAPKADVYDIIASKDCTYTITVTAKLLKMRPKDLTEWLLTNGWMYGKTASTYKPRAQHDRNHLQLVANAYGTQVRVTSKGLVWLARQLKVDLDLDEV